MGALASSWLHPRAPTRARSLRHAPQAATLMMELNMLEEAEMQEHLTWAREQQALMDREGWQVDLNLEAGVRMGDGPLRPDLL